MVDNVIGGGGVFLIIWHSGREFVLPWGGGGLCTPSASHSAKYCFTKPFQAEVTQVRGGGGCT